MLAHLGCVELRLDILISGRGHIGAGAATCALLCKVLDGCLIDARCVAAVCDSKLLLLIREFRLPWSAVSA